MTVTALGSFLNRELRRRDLTPEEFGKVADLGTSHLYQIIRGQKPNPTQGTLTKIARGLNMTTADLLQAIERPRPPQSLDLDDDAEVTARQFTALLHRVPLRSRSAVKTAWRAVAEVLLEATGDDPDVALGSVSGPKAGGASSAAVSRKRDSDHRSDDDLFPLAERYRGVAHQLTPLVSSLN